MFQVVTQIDVCVHVRARKSYGLVWFVFFHHLIFIIQFSSLITLNTIPVWHPSLNIFTLFVGLIPVTRYSFFIFLFLFQYLETRTRKEKKKKKQEHLRSLNPGKKEEEDT